MMTSRTHDIRIAAMLATLALTGTLYAQTPPLTADQCTAYALAHSPDMHKHAIALDNQKLTTLEKRAGFAFGLSINAADHFEDDTLAGSVKLTRELPGGINVSTTVNLEDGPDQDDETGSFSIGLSKLILGGGSVLASRLDILNSELDEVIRANELARFRRELAYNVRRLYYRSIRQHQTLRIQRLRLERARKNLEHAVEREDPLDIATARIEVPENESAVLRAEREIQSSLDEMKELLGMPVVNTLALDLSFNFLETPVSVTNDTAFCLENHEDIVNLRLERIKAERDARVKYARILPSVTLSGNADRDSEDGVDFEGDTEYSARVSLAWDFGSQAARAGYRRATNAITAKALDVDLFALKKTRNIRDLARRLDEALRLITIQEARVELGVRQVELYTDRWENGEIDILEYIRSQNDLENSRIQLINQKTSYMDLVNEYRFVVGY